MLGETKTVREDQSFKTVHVFVSSFESSLDVPRKIAKKDSKSCVTEEQQKQNKKKKNKNGSVAFITNCMMMMKLNRQCK